MCTDLSTISDAYSHDCDWRSMRSSALLRDAAHAAVDVGELAAEDDVQDPRRDRRAEVAVQRRHRAGLDVAAEARAHDELVAVAELLDERRELAEVVRAVAVAHDDVLAADVRERVDVRPTEAALRRRSTRAPRGERDLGRAIRRAVDDQDLADHAGLREALLAPVDEVADRELLVERRDDDRDLGVRDVIRG